MHKKKPFMSHWVLLELHPHGIFFLAPVGGSNPAGPYPYGVQQLTSR